MPLDMAALNALIRQFGQDRAALDEEENRSRTAYNQGFQLARQDFQMQKPKMAAGFADRGMAHSGAAIEADLGMQNQYNLGIGQARENLNLNLASVARRRLEQEAAFREAQLMMQTGVQ